MAKPVKILLLTLVLAVSLVFIKDSATRVGSKITSQLASFSREEKKLLAEGVGEKMTYDVRLGNLRLGKSTFSHLPSRELDGKPAVVMVFETSLARFKDIEVIYSDPQTLLPLRVERDVFNWFTQEKIVEDYNQQNFSVKISKKKGGKTRSLTIKKDSLIHNAVLLPQQIRRLADPAAKGTLIANLPNRKYEIKLLALEEIKVPAGTFKAYHFESIPNHIDVWISADERRIPLKIQSNSVVFGYLLVLRELYPGLT